MQVLSKPVAGIAVGLIKEDDRVAVLSDILGDEGILEIWISVLEQMMGSLLCKWILKLLASPKILWKPLSRRKMEEFCSGRDG